MSDYDEEDDYYSEDQDNYDEEENEYDDYGNPISATIDLDDSPESAGGDKLPDHELLTFTFQQLLHPDFVLKQTRGVNVDVKKSIKVTSLEEDSDDGVDESDEDEEETGESGSAKKLVATVLGESRIEHMTAGFIGDADDATNSTALVEGGGAAHVDAFDATQSRLSRELAALSLSADNYKDLSQRRVYLLSVVQVAYENVTKTLLATKAKPNKNAVIPKRLLLAHTAFSAAVAVLLRVFQQSASSDPALCLEIIKDIKQLLSTIPAAAFSNEFLESKASRQLAATTFDTIHQFLLKLSGAEGMDQSAAVAKMAAHPQFVLIRDQCLELLLTLSVLCSSLSYILSTLKLLLFWQGSNTGLQVRAVLTKFQALSRSVHMEQPSGTNFDTRLVLSDLAEATNFSCCTDGEYMYVHSSLGLMKFGTGTGENVPGQLYVHIAGYRSFERSSIACVGGLLFYRSASLTGPQAIIVLSTQHLLEIGQVHVDGKGSFASADLSGIPFWQPKSKKEKEREKEKEKEASRRAALKAQAAAAASTSAVGASSGGPALQEEKKEQDKPSASSSSSSSIPSGSGEDMAMLMKKKGQSSLGTSRAEELQKKVEEEEARQRKQMEDDRKKREEEEKKMLDPLGAAASEVDAAGKPIKPTVGKDGKPVKDGKPGKDNKPGKDGAASSSTTSGSATEEKKSDEPELDENGMPRARPLLTPTSTKKDDAPAPVVSSSKKATAYFATLLSDSQFLHVVSALPIPTTDHVEISVNSLDAMGDATIPTRLEPAHQITLRASIPSGKAVVRLDNDASAKGQKAKKAPKKAARGNTLTCVKLGCPPHLNFSGSITMECWFRLSQSSAARMQNYQSLLFHGDQTYNTFLCVYTNQLYVGCKSPTASGQATASCVYTPTEWNHVAATYDPSLSQWILYLNGVQVGQAPSTVGHCENSADWVLGSASSYKFQGDLCEARIWKRALTAGQIKKSMVGEFDRHDEALVGYWPLDDGHGLSTRDLSKYQHPGSLMHGVKWFETARPCPPAYIPKDITTYRFHPRTVNEAIMWTNGEFLAILYPPELATLAFPGCTSGVFQSFSLTTGRLMEESLHSYVSRPLASTMTPTGHHLLILQELKGSIGIHRYQTTPPVEVSEWRSIRIKQENANAQDKSAACMNAEVLARWFPLNAEKDEEEKKKAEEEEKKATDEAKPEPAPLTLSRANSSVVHASTEKAEKEKGDKVAEERLTEAELAWFCGSGLDADTFAFGRPDAHARVVDASASSVDLAKEVVDSNTIIMTLLHRLDADRRQINPQIASSSAPPSSLQSLLVVDTCSSTFTHLLDIAEGLSKEYFDPVPTMDSRTRQLRLFAFVTVLRLLRLNVESAVSWQVNPATLGLAEKVDRVGENPNSDRVSGNSTSDTVSVLKTKAPTRTPTQYRYLSLLNHLVLTQPRDPMSNSVSKYVCEEVTETLSVGMSLWWGSDAVARIRVLSDHVRSLNQTKSIWQIQLMQRYFTQQSKPVNIIAIVPAFGKLVASLNAKSTGRIEVIEKQKEMAGLLDRIVTVIIDETKKTIFPPASTSSTVESGSILGLAPPTAAPAVSQPGVRAPTAALQEFLIRVQVVMLAKASGSNGRLQFLLSHVLTVVNSWSRFLSECLSKISPTKPDLILLGSLSTHLKTSLNVMLVPLLTGMLSLSVDVKSSSKLMPALFRLLQAVDSLASLMPDITSRDRALASDSTQRVVTARSTSVESSHPAKAGNTTKNLSMPGVLEMTLTFDPRTFAQMSQGTSVTLYKGPGLSNPIENGTFLSMPPKPIKIQGSSVVIGYYGGYANNWGFKVTAKALVEEESIELPWLLDLSKCIALLAGKSVGLLLKGESVEAVEKSTRTWLDNELLSAGIEHSADVEAEEQQKLKSFSDATREMEEAQQKMLAEEEKEEGEIPPQSMTFLPRQRSYIGVTLTQLARELMAKLKAAKVMLQPFPVKKEVVELVEEYACSLLSVLIKHNQLTTVAQNYLADTTHSKPPVTLVKAYQECWKVRQWLLQRSQQKRSETADDQLKNLDQVSIYREMCEDGIKRCDFLLRVVPVPPPTNDPLAGITRTPSQTKDEDSDDDDVAPSSQMATMAAWQKTKTSVSLRHANPEERFTLLLKLVMNFLSEPLHLSALETALAVRRRRARLRSFGFRALKLMIDTVNLSSVKRELIAALIPSLSWSSKEAAAGVAPSLLTRLTPCGEALEGSLRAAFQSLYASLVNILEQPEKSGPLLLSATLHAFSLQYTESDFHIAVGLGLFPVLKKILLNDVALDGVDSSSKKKDEPTNQSHQTSAWALLDLLTTVLSRQQSLKHGHNAAEDALNEPVYDILLSQLEKISTSLLAARKEQLLVDAKSGHGAVEGAIDNTSGFIPQLPSHVTQLSALRDANTSLDANQAQVSRKVATVSAFGMATSLASHDLADVEGGSKMNASADLYSDAFTIRVLKLVDHISSLEHAAKRIRTKAGLSALITILQYGTPRSQIVALRLMKKMLASASVNTKEVTVDVLGMLDSVITLPSETKLPVSVGGRSLAFFLRHIGRLVCAPAFSALALQDHALAALQVSGGSKLSTQVRMRLADLAFYANSSTDGVAAFPECVMLLRYLAKRNKVWSENLSQAIVQSIRTIPALIKKLNSFKVDPNATSSAIAISIQPESPETQLALSDAECALNMELFEQIFSLLGCLSVFGSHIQPLCVGSKVRLLSVDSNGTVVSRDSLNKSVSVVRDGIVTDEKSSLVVNLGSMPFEINDFNVDITAVITGLTEALVLVGDQFKNWESAGTEESKPKAPALTRAKSLADEQSEVVKESTDVSVSNITISILQAHVSKALHSLLQLPSVVETVLKSSVGSTLFSSLLASSTQLTAFSDSPKATTSILEDRAFQLWLENLKRARPLANIVVSLHHVAPRVRIAHPSVELEAEYTNAGGSVESDRSVRGPLTYIRLNETPTVQTCKNRIILLDTYGGAGFPKRLLEVAECQPKAIILGLHSLNAKAENLAREDDDDDDDDEPTKKSGSGDMLREARERVMAEQAAMTQSLFSGGMGMGGRGGGRGGFGGGGRGGRSGGAVAETAAPAARKKVKKDKSEVKDIPAPLRALPVLAVSMESANLLRVAMSVRDEDDPERLNTESLRENLVKRGYPKQHTLRALQKNEMDVDAAAKWLDENAEWLYADTTVPATTKDEKSEEKYPEAVSTAPGSIAAPAVPAVVAASSTQIVSKLQACWSVCTSVLETNTDGGPASRMAWTAPKSWTQQLASKSSAGLLVEFAKVQRALFIHYTRRALVKTFLSLPTNLPLTQSPFADPIRCKLVLRLLFALDVFPASELTRALESVMKPLHGFRQQLVGLMTKRLEAQKSVVKSATATDAVFLPGLLLDESITLMTRTSNRTFAPDNNSVSRVKVQTVQVTKNSNQAHRTNRPGAAGQANTNSVTALTVNEFDRMRVTVAMDDRALQSGYQATVQMYSDAAGTQLIHTVTLQTGLPGGEEILIPKNTFYYSASSPHYSPGGQPISVHFSIKNVALAGAEGTIQESSLLRGNLQQALQCIDLAMRLNNPLPLRILLLLLSSLPHIDNERLVIECCRMAIRLFNHFDLLESETPFNQLSPEQLVIDVSQVNDIGVNVLAAARKLGPVRIRTLQLLSIWISHLESAHAALRTEQLLEWNRGSLPTPHLQVLLELVIAGRRVLTGTDGIEDESANDAAMMAGTAAAAAPVSPSHTETKDDEKAESEPDSPVKKGKKSLKAKPKAKSGGRGIARHGNQYQEPFDEFGNQIVLDDDLGVYDHPDDGDDYDEEDGEDDEGEDDEDEDGESDDDDDDPDLRAAMAASVATASNGFGFGAARAAFPTLSPTGFQFDAPAPASFAVGFGPGYGGFSQPAHTFGQPLSLTAGPTAAATSDKKEEDAKKKPKVNAQTRVTPPQPYELQAYRSFRDGQSTVSLIDILSKRLQTSHLLVQSPTGPSSFGGQAGREFYIGDVAVRGGGQWYFEVKISAVPELVQIGFCTRQFRFHNAYTNLGQDPQGESWAFNSPHSQYMHRGLQSFPTPIDSGLSAAALGRIPRAAGAKSVVGVSLDLEAGEIQYHINGKSTGIAFSGLDSNIAFYPCILLGRNSSVEVNFGQKKWFYPPTPPKRPANSVEAMTAGAAAGSSSSVAAASTATETEIQWVPFEHPGINSSSWLSRYRYSSAVTGLVFRRARLPETVIREALKNECSLVATPMRFQVVKTAAGEPTVANSPDNALSEDDNSYFTCTSVSNFCMTFAAQGNDIDVLLQEIQIRCQQNQSLNGMVFLSAKQPDYDSFANFDSYTQAQYDAFVSEKKAARQALRAHEPVAFFQSINNSNTVRVKLDAPRRCRFITLKLSAMMHHQPLMIQRITFKCVHGSHPLGALIGTPLLASKQAEMKQQLMQTAMTMSMGTSTTPTSASSSSSLSILGDAPPTTDIPWTRSMDESLVGMVSVVCSKLGIEPSSLDAIMLNPGQEERMRFKLLEQTPIQFLRARFAIIKYLNKLVTPLLGYVDIRMMSEETDEEDASDPSAIKQRFDTHSLSYMIHDLKDLYWMSTKKSVFDSLLSNGGSSAPQSRAQQNANRPRVNVNRMKAAKSKENKAKDPDALNSVFGQLFTQLKAANYRNFRGAKNEQMFSVNFLGEGSIDVGGPYRDALTQMCGDLMSDTVGLFIRAPNRRNDVGLNRDRWCINPSSTSALHMQQYEFIGALMGMALRTSQPLTLDLSNIIWKRLLNHTVDQVDLEAIDKLCIQALNELSNASKSSWDELDLHWTTQLSNGKEIELRPNGRQTLVPYSDRAEFVRLTIHHRLTESDAQLTALKKGLNQVVPAHLLSLFSFHDLERMTCGDPEVNIETLRKHTIYRGITETAPLIGYFWKALESFTSEERQLFLRFVWGRSRLPISESDWTSEFTIHSLKEGDENKLPISHTCFFSIELPAYNSYENLREKLLYAIVNCMAIDVDFNPDSQALAHWAED